jgi:hypothetical protein
MGSAAMTRRFSSQRSNANSPAMIPLKGKRGAFSKL